MVTFDYYENSNTLLANFNNPYDPVQDTMSVIQELTKRLDANDQELNYISDLTHIEVSFTDMVQGLAQAFATPGSVFANPRLKMYTALGDDEIVKLGATAVSEQDQYGKVPMKVFATVDEALAEVNS